MTNEQFSITLQQEAEILTSIVYDIEFSLSKDEFPDVWITSQGIFGTEFIHCVATALLRDHIEALKERANILIGCNVNND